MGIAYNTSIVRDGLVLHLDAANVKSYPGSGTVWTDLSGNGNNFSIVGSLPYDASGFFTLTNAGYIYRASMPTTNTACTCTFILKTTDQKSLFWGLYNSTSRYLGAYRIDNKYYNGSVGTPTYYQDLTQQANIFDFLPDNNWHMIEFKSVNFSGWTSLAFNQYASFIFENGAVSCIQIYDRVLSADESQQNFEALRGRYGI